MRNVRLGIVFVVLTVSASAISFADVRHELAANYEKETWALQHKNVDVIAKLLAPDFTSSQIGGTSMNRETFLQTFRAQVGQLEKVTRTHSIKSLSTSGGLATLTVDGATTATIVVQGKPHVIDVKQTSKDVWIKHGGGWLLKSSVVLKRDLKMDGRSMNPPGAGAGSK